MLTQALIIPFSSVWPCAHTQSSMTKCHFSCYLQDIRKGSFDLLCQPMNVCQPLCPSLPLFDSWTMRQVVPHSEHTRIVFMPETFPLPDRRRHQELGYGPHGNVTQTEIRWWCEITRHGLLFCLSADNSDPKVVSLLCGSHTINLWTMGHVRVLLVFKN